MVISNGVINLCADKHVVDTFGGALGEPNARAFEVYGDAFMACRPGCTALPEAECGHLDDVEAALCRMP